MRKLAATDAAVFGGVTEDLRLTRRRLDVLERWVGGWPLTYTEGALDEGVYQRVRRPDGTFEDWVFEARDEQRRETEARNARIDAIERGDLDEDAG